jgi:hypothetical protein
MAILSLFPLGAAQMAQALKDQRTAEAAANASALARVVWKQACDAANTQSPPFRDSNMAPTSKQPFVYALDDPNYTDAANGNPLQPAGSFNLAVTAYPNDMARLPITTAAGATSSYPVFVDPIGWQANSADPVKQWWVGASQPLVQPTTNGPPTKGLIPRRPLYIQDPTATTTPRPWIRLGAAGSGLGGASLASTQRILKQFALLDDITFTDNGTPDTSSGRMDRQGRYSWSYLIRRVRNDSTSRLSANINVVVYNGRSIDVPSNETQYYAVGGASDSRLLTLLYDPTSKPKPAVRRGVWILDSTIFTGTGQVFPFNVFPQAHFYRVVNVEDGATVSGSTLGIGNTTYSSVNVELQTPLAYGPAVRIFLVLENVSEVFDIGEVLPTSPPRLDPTAYQNAL